MIAVLLVLWAHVGGAEPSQLRYSRDAEGLFTRAVAAYAAGDLSAATEAFAAVVELPGNQRTTAALLMLGRSLQHRALRAEDAGAASQWHREAITAARRLIRMAPTSRYVADARLVAGDSYYALKRYYEAATEYARVLAAPGPLSVQAMASERLAAIVGNRAITTGALERIELEVGGRQRLRDVLVFGQARWYERLGWAAPSRQRYGVYVDSIGVQGRFYDMARRRLRARSAAAPEAVVEATAVPAASDTSLGSDAWTLSSGRQGVPRLGVLAPLTGPDWERHIGRRLVEGARLANRDLGEPFDLVVIDTGRDYVDDQGELVPIYQSEASRMVRVVAATRFLVDRVRVAAIVGPVFSTSCAAAAGVAEAAGVPLVIPLAEQSGLDTLGSHVFQLNPIPEVQGKALAEYATLALGLETLAVLSPLSDYGYAFEQAFTRAAVANGGRVVHSDWYYPRETKDFHAQFISLRNVGFALAPDTTASGVTTVFDSLETALLDTGMVGMWTFEELVRAPPLVTAPVDSADIFVDSIDGVAIVVESFEDAARIAPQLRFHRLQTQILGNALWNDPESVAQMPRAEREHLRGAIFVSRRTGSAIEREFIDRLRLETGHDDDGYDAAGYDAATIVLRGWQEGHQGRAALRQYLAGLRGYEGVSGAISFTAQRRVNVELALLTIEANGTVRPLRQDDLPDLSASLATDTDLPAESLPEAGSDAHEEAGPDSGAAGAGP